MKRQHLPTIHYCKFVLLIFRSQFVNTLLSSSMSDKSKGKLFFKPIPKDWGMLSLTIIRKNSGFNKFYPKYILKTEHTDEFVLNAKKRIGNKKSNYMISMKDGEFDKKKDSFIAKLRLLYSNKYMLYDSGENFERNMYASRFKLRNEYGYEAIVIYIEELYSKETQRNHSRLMSKKKKWLLELLMSTMLETYMNSNH